VRAREGDHVLGGEADVPELLHERSDAGRRRREVDVGALEARRAAVLPAGLYLPARPSRLKAAAISVRLDSCE
jgi:hypothetical protein